MIPEDPEERASWDRAKDLLWEGSSATALIVTLSTMASTLPPQGSFAKVLAICANEVERLESGERQRQIALLEEILEAIEPMRDCQAATFCGLDHVKSKLDELRMEAGE
jgi:hypothetical protein